MKKIQEARKTKAEVELSETIDQDIIASNEEIAEDVGDVSPDSVVVFSRDWTIETIYNQISQKNIDLNPKFQRRNAWTDLKRSKLIESILMGYPVPEIVLAEDPQKKRAFIVIDGKQRLLTIAGFIEHDNYRYWDTPKLSNLTVKDDLNGITYEALRDLPEYSNYLREFRNSSLRCTVITGFKGNDILYDIFYRLNSGSTPLSTQELRQVLHRGDFADYLTDVTNKLQPIHHILNLKEPDNRLRDIEILLRLISFTLYPKDYKGNLKKFLDEKMALITRDWSKYKSKIKRQYTDLNSAMDTIADVVGGYNFVGRKITDGDFEKRFNRVLFEVQLFYQLKLGSSTISKSLRNRYIAGFKKLCENPEFRSSIESSTKNMESYRNRYILYGKFINSVFGKNIASPF